MTPGLVDELCAVLAGPSRGVPARKPLRAELVELARAHRVDLLLAWRTGQIDDRVRVEAMIDEVRVRELNRALAALDSAGVPAIVLKGAALAHSHYEASWLRIRLDADVLVPESQKAAAFRALSEAGYARLPFTSGSMVAHQAPYARVDGLGIRHDVDVHWRVAEPHVLADVLSYADLASRATTLAVRGRPMRMPAPVDALLLACVHRAAHHNLADDLLWLYDVHLLAERLGGEEWPDLAGLATRYGVGALCANGLERARALYQTPIPDAVLERLKQQSAGEPSSVFLRADLRPVDRLVLDLAATGPARGLRLLREHLVPPGDYMRQRYGVRHDALLPLFYAGRAIGGVSKWFSRRLPAARTRTDGRSSSGAL